MIRAFSLGFALACATLISSAPALASSTLEKSCGVIQGLVKGGGDGGAAEIMALASHWPSADREKLRGVLAPTLRRFSYTGGSVYLVTDLGDDSQEHLLTLRVKGGGVAYLRLTYENKDDSLQFYYVDFRSKLSDLLRVPFTQKPEKMECP